MSLMSMRRKMASQRTASTILWLLIVVFVAGIALLSVPNKNIGDMTAVPGGDSKKVIATVNGKKITAGQLEEEFAKRNTTGQQSLDVFSALGTRKQTLDVLVQQAIAQQALREEHIGTIYFWTLRPMAREFARYQLDMIVDGVTAQAKAQADAAKTPKEKAAVQSADAQVREQLIKYMSTMSAAKSNPKETLDDIKARFVRTFADKRLLNRDKELGMYDEFYQSAQMRLLGEKLVKQQPMVYPEDPFSEKMAKKLYTKEVKASWILIRPTDQSAAGLDAARKKAEELRDQLAKSPSAFVEKAKANSADMATAQNGGDLGWVNKDSQMVRPSAIYQLFILSKNEISKVVTVADSDPSGALKIGYAIYKASDERNMKNPKAYDAKKDKEAALAMLKTVFAPSFAEVKLAQINAAAKIEYLSDEAKFYQVQYTDQKKAQDLQKKLADATDLPQVVSAAFKFQQAFVTKDPNEKATLLEHSISFAGTQTIVIQMELARAYAEAGRKDQAILQFTSLADGIENDKSSYDQHKMLKDEFKKLGDTKNVQRMDEWMKKNPPAPADDSSWMNNATAIPISIP